MLRMKLHPGRMKCSRDNSSPLASVATVVSPNPIALNPRDIESVNA